jgi:hypothetical protein
MPYQLQGNLSSVSDSWQRLKEIKLIKLISMIKRIKQVQKLKPIEHFVLSL